MATIGNGRKNAWGTNKENNPTLIPNKEPPKAPIKSDDFPAQKHAWGKQPATLKQHAKPAPAQVSIAHTQPAPSQQTARPQAVGRNPFQDKGVHLITNMYRLHESKISTLASKVYRYEMDVYKDGATLSEPPPSASANLERALVLAMRRMPAFNKGMFSDGKKILYSLGQLEIENACSKETKKGSEGIQVKGMCRNTNELYCISRDFSATPCKQAYICRSS
jgi:hypothetical protein